MFEVLEHVPKQDGQFVLQRLSTIPFFMLSTPTKYFSQTGMNGHLSLWSEAELQQYGFKTQIVKLPFYLFPYGNCILAVKENV
jgi:hypothetical protein